ncbi:MAG: rhamnose/proton symporter RhaT, partial [Planctomycetes bacterium]|nr:rhamnose/proton symporter RhaT [Planctomycetota bacterium]
READEHKEGQKKPGKKSMAAGIIIAVVGGLLATGFNVAFTVGGGPLAEAVVDTGNAGWTVAVAVMFPVFLSGGVIMTGYFAWQLSAKKAWGSFKTPSLGLNFALIFVMAFFHYAASAGYAFGASRFDLGPVVVYAIFNATCVIVAVVSGIITKEWINASARARKSLYAGLACMVLGVMVLTVSKLPSSQDTEPEAVPVTAIIEAGV